MATEEKYPSLIPPRDITVVGMRVRGGPSFHAIEHAVCAPDHKDIVGRPLRFGISIRHFFDQPEARSLDQCWIEAEFVLVSLRRLGDSRITISGHLHAACVAFPDTIFMEPSIHITYDLEGRYGKPRTGTMQMSRACYLGLLLTYKDEIGKYLSTD